MKISQLLLKLGAANGLTLAQIGEILCRPDEDDEEPSILEKIVTRSEESSTQYYALFNESVKLQAQINSESAEVIEAKKSSLLAGQIDDHQFKSKLRESIGVADETDVAPRLRIMTE